MKTEGGLELNIFAVVYVFAHQDTFTFICPSGLNYV